MLVKPSERALVLEGKSLADIARDFVFANLSPSSARIYDRTYRRWLAYAKQRGVHPLNFSYLIVQDFIAECKGAKSTREAHLAHIRKLVKVLAAFDNSYQEVYYQIANLLKVRREDGMAKREPYSKRALTADELAKVLAVWADDDRRIGLRNHAMIRLLIYTGARRSEIASLQWRDIDLDGMTIRIRHGKGDKERVAAIAGDISLAPIDPTYLALKSLKECQGDYEYVFPRMSATRNPQWSVDEPSLAQTVAVVVRETSKRAGIGHFSPHDLRRTHITLALRNGAPLADMQAQAGHANASTTMLYAQASDAASRRRRIKLG